MTIKQPTCPTKRLGRTSFALTAMLTFSIIANAQTVSEPAQTAQTPIQIMLNKADFWYTHGQENVALETYQRVLNYDSANSEALIGAARMGLILGRVDLAHGYIERLRKTSPKDPALAELDATVGRRPDQVRALTDARHLAAAAKRKEAIAKYKQLFDGDKIPDDIAGEYYYLYLQEVEDGSVEAEQVVDKMTSIAQAHAGDANYQISLAHCLVLLGDHRPDAIDIYAKLARDPALTTRVRPLWREAILWSGIDIKAREQLLDYLSMFPSDPQLDAIQEKMHTDLPSRALMVILLGNTQLDNGQFPEAEVSFNKAMQLDPNEIQGPVMMSVLRMKQGRVADAKAMIQKAIKIAPEKKDELLGIVGEGKAGLNQQAIEEARRQIEAQYHEVVRLTDTGHYAEAEALLQKIQNGREDPGGLMMLADIRHRSGKDDTVMALLQRAAQIAPNNPDVNLSLGVAQARAGQVDAATASLDRAEAALRASDAPQMGDAKQTDGLAKKFQTLRQARAELARRRAEALSDPVLVVRGLRDAATLDPTNPWTTLALARALDRNNQQAEANQAIAPLLREADAPNAAQTDTGIEALNAAFIWVRSHNDNDRALRIARLVPEAKRSESIRSALALADLRRQVAQILPLPDASRRLIALASQPDPDGTRGDLISRALLRLTGVVEMREALSAGLKATPPPLETIRIRYAGVLVEMRQFGAAARLLQLVNPRALDSDQAEGFERATDYLVAAQVQTALAANSPARAEAALAKRGLRQNTSLVLKVAAARIRIARGAPREALATLMEMLNREPNDPNIRSAAIDAAATTHDLSLARDLADEGMRRHPENPFMAMQAAYVARQDGRTREALDDMRKARALHYEQLEQEAPLANVSLTER